MTRHSAAWLLAATLSTGFAACSGADSERAGSAGSGGAAAAGTGAGGSGGASGGSGLGGAGAANGGAPTGGGGGAATGGNGTGGTSAMPTKTFVYVATGDWGQNGAGRIRIYALDDERLTLSSIDAVPAGTLPSYMTFDPTGQTLYAGDEEEGVLRAYAVERATGRLTPIGGSTAARGHPVYVSVDAEARYLLAAYYNEGQVEVFGIGDGGAIGASIVAPDTGSQAHSIVIAPDNRFVFVPNKGSNTISQLVLGEDGRLTPNEPAGVPASGGPRHLTFHPSRALAYVVNELDSSVRAYRYDDTGGVLEELERHSTLPPGFTGDSSGADIHVEPGGRFLYTSNRAGAASTLAIFAIDAQSGGLNLVGHEPTRGNTPRNFGIHPRGHALLVANQDSNSVVTFRLDGGSGTLTFVEDTDVADKAWCVRFLVVPDED